MIYERESDISGRTNQMEIFGIELEDIEQWKKSGKLIQDYFPFLTPSEREFILSGATDEEWDDLLKFLDPEDDNAN